MGYLSGVLLKKEGYIPLRLNKSGQSENLSIYHSGHIPMMLSLKLKY